MFASIWIKFMFTASFPFTLTRQLTISGVLLSWKNKSTSVFYAFVLWVWKNASMFGEKWERNPKVNHISQKFEMTVIILNWRLVNIGRIKAFKIQRFNYRSQWSTNLDTKLMTVAASSIHRNFTVDELVYCALYSITLPEANNHSCCHSNLLN